MTFWDDCKLPTQAERDRTDNLLLHQFLKFTLTAFMITGQSENINGKTGGFEEVVKNILLERNLIKISFGILFI